MKYSKQRELILNYVLNSYEHPTADMVYKAVQKDMPNISLGTVYRNLNQLCESNLIRRIILPNKIDRFDKIYQEHCHLYCNNCEEIIDINKDLMLPISDKIKKLTNYEIISHNIVFIGICFECQKEKGR